MDGWMDASFPSVLYQFNYLPIIYLYQFSKFHLSAIPIQTLVQLPVGCGHFKFILQNFFSSEFCTALV